MERLSKRRRSFVGTNGIESAVRDLAAAFRRDWPEILARVWREGLSLTRFQAPRFAQNGGPEATARPRTEGPETASRPDGRGQPEAVASLADIAHERQRQGDLVGAEAFFRRALDDYEGTGGGHDLQASAYRHRLAMTLFLQSDLKTAEPLFRDALEIRRKFLGDRHPQTAECMSDLALLLLARGDLSGAEALVSRALDVRTEHLGRHHPETRMSERDAEFLLRKRDGENPADSATASSPPPASAAESDGTPPEADRTVPMAYEGTRRRHNPGGPELESIRKFTTLLVCNDIPTLPTSEAWVLGGGDGHSARIGDEMPSPEESSDPKPELCSGSSPTRVCPQDHEGTCRAALLILEQTRRLSHVNRSDEAALLRCQAEAEVLQSANSAGDPTPDLARLAEGSHPLAALVTLVNDRERVSDHQWAVLHELVSQSYGRSLALAASRGQLLIRSVP